MQLRTNVTICLVFCASLHPVAKGEPAACNDRLHYLEWTQVFYDTADAVFLGKVTSEETPDPIVGHSASPSNGKTMADLLEEIKNTQKSQSTGTRQQEASILVEKVWKGLVESSVNVTADLYFNDTGYYPVLNVGETVLVFAYKGVDEEVFYIPIGCAAPREANETDSKIRVLDALTKKPGDP